MLPIVVLAIRPVPVEKVAQVVNAKSHRPVQPVNSVVRAVVLMCSPTQRIVGHVGLSARQERAARLVCAKVSRLLQVAMGSCATASALILRTMPNTVDSATRPANRESFVVMAHAQFRIRTIVEGVV